MRRERRRPRGIEAPQFADAGAFMRGEIEKTGLSIKAWAERHRLAPTTLYRICKGSYNFGNECSVAMLWEIAKAIRPLDYDAQREFVHQVLQTARILPPPDRLTLTYALLATRRELERLNIGVKKLEHLQDRRDRTRDRLATEREQEAAQA